MNKSISLVMPVHNEAASIETTISEWLEMAAREQIQLEVIATEDGSTDGTREILETLASTDSRVRAVTSVLRKGYSQAVADGIRSASAELVCCVDSDGQCDPRDLVRLLALVTPTNVVCGIRTPRNDSLVRRTMSNSFRFVYRLTSKVRLVDPSCPYVLGVRENMLIPARFDPVLPQGYWWEFHARLLKAGIESVEAPVSHRRRLDGKTRVYKLSKVPRIAVVHLAGLFKIRNSPGK